MSAQLEQIARIVYEQGYWKPNGRVQDYRRQDVYTLFVTITGRAYGKMLLWKAKTSPDYGAFLRLKA